MKVCAFIHVAVAVMCASCHVASSCQNPVMSCPSTCAVASDLERDEEIFKRELLHSAHNTTNFCERVRRLEITGSEKRQKFYQKRKENSNRISTQQITIDQLTLSRDQLLDKQRGITEMLDVVLRLEEENRQLVERVEDGTASLRQRCSPDSTTDNCPGQFTGRDCAEIYSLGGRRSGAYLITAGTESSFRLVYCDQETDGGGWTQIQRHVSNAVEFNRDWQAYKLGFGRVSCNGDGDYWLGNEYIHSLTTRHQHLRVDVKDWSTNDRYALYTHFGVGPESTDYTLTLNGYQSAQSGDIGDAFAGHNFGKVDDISITKHRGMPFSTYDRDNDKYRAGTCARHGGGGWWYNSCSAVNLNGKVYEGGHYQKSDTIYGYDNAMIWGTWKGLWYSLKKSSMKIRPASFQPNTEV